MTHRLRSVRTWSRGAATRFAVRRATLVFLCSALGACAASLEETADGERDAASTSQALTAAPDTGCVAAANGGRAYWFCPTLRSWATARSKCQAIGFDLASVGSLSENQFLLTKQSSNGWISGGDSAVEGAWRWADSNVQFWQGAANGSAVGGAYTNWLTLEPNNTLNQDCLIFRGGIGNGKWSDESCTATAKFICEGDLCPSDPNKTDPGQCGCGTPDTDTDGDGTANCNDACPADPHDSTAPCNPDSDCMLKQYNGKDYFFCRNLRNYATAKQKCEAVGFKLARSDNAGENNFIDDAILTDRWVGGNDVGVEGRWTWDIGGDRFWQGTGTGSPVNGAYTNWLGGKPNNALDADCLQIGVAGLWWDDNCISLEQYVCEDVDVCGGCAASTSPCTRTFCDERSATCLSASNEGATCNDGNSSTTGELCVMGACKPPPAVPQERCGSTNQQYIDDLRNDPGYAATRRDMAQEVAEYQFDILAAPFANERTEVIQIPVVFHVVGDAATQALITDAKIQEQLARLNLDYRGMGGTPPAEFASVAADMLLEFVIAKRDPSCMPTTGITRRVNPTGTQWCMSKRGCENESNDADAIKRSAASVGQAQPMPQRGTDAWDTDRYLNIWIGRSASGTAGRGTFPGEDTPEVQGVIVDEISFGNQPPPSGYTLGRTLVHEIGHYLNLRHTFEVDGSCVGVGAPGSGSDACNVAGDGVCDTPPLTGPHSVCPAPTRNTCHNDSPDQNDMSANFMDYTWDACLSMFTAGQKIIVDATLDRLRPGLKSSSGLIPPPTGVFDLWVADSADDIGNQPNNQTAELWKSQDIWIRHRHDDENNQEHQNPIFLAPGETTEDGYDHNHVYLNVRNRGCSNTTATYANMFWAKASTSLSWPAPWNGTETVPGTSTPMGGRVNNDAGQNFVLVPQLTAGQRTVVKFDWTVPNPADYASFGGNRSHFCLLALVDACAGNNFNPADHTLNAQGQINCADTDSDGWPGAFTREGPAPNPLIAGQLDTNVRNNNNMAWKNVTVAGPENLNLESFGSVGTGGTPDGVPARFVFTEATTPERPVSVFDWGNVYVDLGTTLHARWVAAGRPGSGVAQAIGTQVRLTAPVGIIDNIPMAASERFTIDVRFDPFVSAQTTQRKQTDAYVIDMTQYAKRAGGNQVVGGNSFVLKTHRLAVEPD